MSIRIVSATPDPEDWGPDPKTRRNDSLGAHLGAKSARMRANGQKARLLVAYAQAGRALIADEAGELAGIPIERSSHWTRCSELARLGFLKDTGEVRASTRTHSPQRVYIITLPGLLRAKQLLGR